MSTLDVPSRRLVQTKGFHQPGVGALLDQLPLALLMLDEELRIQWWNHAAEELSGRSRDEVIGADWGQELLLTWDADPGDSHACPLSFLRHRKGYLVPVQTQAAPLPPGCGAARGAVVSVVDCSPAMSILEHARRAPDLDLIDLLTRVGNRRLAALELEAFLIRCQLHQREFGVVLFDADMLHLVNERFGYDCSDHALRIVARTLLGCLDAQDVLCRWGGDQFLALVVGNCAHVDTKAELCRWAVESCSLDWFGQPVPLTVSAGVEMVSPGDHAEDLVGRAAFRLRMSKRLGRNRVTSCVAAQASVAAQAE